MTLKSQIAADLADSTLFFSTDGFAESVTYTPSGGVAKTITAIRDEENPASQTPIPPGDTMIVVARSTEVTAPGRGDAYAIGGETWYHDSIESGGAGTGVYRIRVSRSARKVVEGRAFLS